LTHDVVDAHPVMKKLDDHDNVDNRVHEEQRELVKPAVNQDLPPAPVPHAVDKSLSSQQPRVLQRDMKQADAVLL